MLDFQERGGLVANPQQTPLPDLEPAEPPRIVIFFFLCCCKPSMVNAYRLYSYKTWGDTHLPPAQDSSSSFRFSTQQTGLRSHDCRHSLSTLICSSAISSHVSFYDILLKSICVVMTFKKTEIQFAQKHRL